MGWDVKNSSDDAKRRAYETRMSGAVRDTDGMMPIAHMDEADLDALYQRFPELDDRVNLDGASCRKAWEKWMRSSASEPYRLRTKL